MKLRNLFLAGFLVSLGFANANEITLPGSSVLPGVVIIGTSVGKSEPVLDAPIKLKITNGELKNCFVIALVTPNWSTNTVYAQLARLQCKSGSEIKSVDMKGWIIDSDNKIGIPNGSTSKEIMNVNAGIKTQFMLYEPLTIDIQSK